jgi:arabinose-5-phosphate isomerase
MFSNSGNTKELLNIIPILQNIGLKIIGICCNDKSEFTRLCDTAIVLPFNKEIGGNIDKIPTNSIMSQLIFCNLLVSILKDNIDIDTYKDNHLSGNIGIDLLQIKDVLKTEYPKIIINLNDSIELNEILLEMTQYKIGCCFFVNNDNELFGILTDGDIRKLLIKNKVEYITMNHINDNYYYEIDKNKFIFSCKKYNYIPLLKNKILEGFFSNN